MRNFKGERERCRCKNEMYIGLAGPAVCVRWAGFPRDESSDCAAAKAQRAMRSPPTRRVAAVTLSFAISTHRQSSRRYASSFLRRCLRRLGQGRPDKVSRRSFAPVSRVICVVTFGLSVVSRKIAFTPCFLMSSINSETCRFDASVSVLTPSIASILNP